MTIREFIKELCPNKDNKNDILNKIQDDFINPLQILEDKLRIEANRQSTKPSILFYTLKNIIEKKDFDKYLINIVRKPERRFMNYKINLLPLDVSEGLSDGKMTISEILSIPFSVLIMSATLGGPDLFGKTLGLKNFYTHSIDHFFISPEHYFVFIYSNISSIYTKRDYNIPRYIKLINIINNNFPQYKKLIAFISYDLRKKILKDIGILTNLESVVFGGKGTRGVDYSEHLINLLAGYPALPYKGINKARQRYLVQKYGQEIGEEIYNHSTIAKVIQMMGRTLRKSKDKSIIILADDRYKNMKLFKRIPSYFQKRNLEIKNENDLIGQLKIKIKEFEKLE